MALFSPCENDLFRAGNRQLSGKKACKRQEARSTFADGQVEECEVQIGASDCPTQRILNIGILWRKHSTSTL